MSDKKNTEIAVNEGFAALANRDVLNEAMADDCQGLEFSFDRVKLPAGGGTAFEIPSAESDESEMAKDITGVIVYNHPAYAYYHDKYTGGNNPPDCGSFDGVTGIGTPGGNCQNRPYNKFGSGEGQSKLCKNKRMLGVVNEIRIISNARIRKDCESEELCIERQKEAEKFLSEKVAAGLDQLLSNENLRLDLNTSRELFSLTGGGVRLNGEYVPVQAIKIDEALKAIPMPES